MLNKKQKIQILVFVLSLIYVLAGMYADSAMIYYNSAHSETEKNNTRGNVKTEITEERHGINSFVPEDEVREEKKNTEQPGTGQLYALSACLTDADTGRVLYEKNGNDCRAMASTTKIMTLLIILENAAMDEIVTVSKRAAAQPDVQLNLREGEQYRLEDLLYSLMLESHNDTAVALAEHVGGSVEGFCDLMNEKAKELGLVQTHFETPNGLDSENHKTTAVELSKLAVYAMQNEEFIKITNTTQHCFKDCSGKRSYVVNNKNRFLYMFDGAIGVKTGFTSQAGYCFVGAIRRGDHNLIAVVLGSGWPPNKNYKWSDTLKLMNYGIDHYSKVKWEENASVTVRRKDDYFVFSNCSNRLEDYIDSTIVVSNGKQNFSSLRLEWNGCPLSENMLLAPWDDVTIKINLPKEVEAPIYEGEIVGNVSIHINDEVLGEMNIIATETVPKITYSDYWDQIWNIWLRP